jgi:hypothetical protein
LFLSVSQTILQLMIALTVIVKGLSSLKKEVVSQKRLTYPTTKWVSDQLK